MRTLLLLLIQNVDGSINPHFKKIIKSNNTVYNNVMCYYTDSESLQESVYRIIYNMNIRPICPICGNKLKFYSITRGFLRTCSVRCGQLHEDTQNKIKLTCLQKYGETNALKNKDIHNKTILTIQERYGVNNVSKLDFIKKKKEETNLLKYGIKCFLQHPFMLYKRSVAYKNNNTPDKIRKTVQNRYGVDNVSKLDFIKKKKIDTCLKNFNVNFPMLSYIVLQKSILTCIQKYNVDNVSKINVIKLKKQLTLHKNNTYVTSKPENYFFELLIKLYPETKRQYSTELYPFKCDFYIPNIDLYIEYNGTWTHGFKPFTNSVDDNEILCKWIKKSLNSAYYKSAINVWTVSDVLKRETAKNNKLNFVEIWNKNEINIFIENLRHEMIQ